MGEITQAANMFRRHGLCRGDVVAILLPNLPETHWAMWGGETAAIAMPINPLLEPAMIATLLKAAGVKALVTLAPTPHTDIWEKVMAIVKDLPELQMVFTVSPLKYYRGLLGRALELRARIETPKTLGVVKVFDFNKESAQCSGDSLAFEPPGLEDIASYFCTGGTTGTPKIAMRRHETEVANSMMIVEALPGEMAAGTTLFCGLPIFHVNAQLVTGLIPWSQGAHVVLGSPQGYRGEGVVSRFWEIVEHHRITAFSGVPTLYAALMKTPLEGRDLSCLRFAICGAAPLPLQLLQQFELETGIAILEGYGLTEAGCASTLNPIDARRAGSVGVSLPGQRLLAMILNGDGRYLRDAADDEAGVLAVHGPNTFCGYLDPVHDRGLWIERPESDGRSLKWLNTGDIGRIDKRGFVYLTGRKKELIIRGGHNIDPRLIEEPMHRHPAVAVAAAVGRPDAYSGEVPSLFIQLFPGATATVDELTAFAERSIAERAALPKHIQILPALPTTSVGKVFKPALSMMEIEHVVRHEAALCNVVLVNLAIRQDAKKGFVARYEALGQSAALQEALGRYTFAVESGEAPPFVTN